MPVIVPAILEETKEGFLDKVSRMVKLPGVERIQVDFVDGVFVPHKILPVSEIDSLSPAIHWEAHLMVKAPDDFLDYQICGFKTIIIHFEAYDSADELKKALSAIHSLGMKTGLAINPSTEVSVFKDFADCDQYLLLSVDPGFQGAEFKVQTPERIKQLREMFPHGIIEVDGGVNLHNIKSIAQAGCDLISVGSALTHAPDMTQAYEQLLGEIHRVN